MVKMVMATPAKTATTKMAEQQQQGDNDSHNTDNNDNEDNDNEDNYEDNYEDNDNDNDKDYNKDDKDKDHDSRGINHSCSEDEDDHSSSGCLGDGDGDEGGDNGDNVITVPAPVPVVQYLSTPDTPNLYLQEPCTHEDGYGFSWVQTSLCFICKIPATTVLLISHHSLLATIKLSLDQSDHLRLNFPQHYDLIQAGSGLATFGLMLLKTVVK
ncbi:hypothetical protein EDB85DRAFT_1888168 [Lactarius pseudohatsudake]|nr:hypothetical protein EDB85DRAFT_1888168 [Lactarius pseudohatsudake]